jgi:predicted RNase H-like HicB family nuclease
MERGASRSPDTQEITIRESDGYFVARDEETGVSSQGGTKVEALQNLAEALALYEEPVLEDEDASEKASAPWF